MLICCLKLCLHIVVCGFIFCAVLWSAYKGDKIYIYEPNIVKYSIENIHYVFLTDLDCRQASLAPGETHAECGLAVSC